MSNIICLGMTQELLEIKKLANQCTAVRTYCSQDTAFELMKIEEDLKELYDKLVKQSKEAEARYMKKFLDEVQE